LQRRKRETIRNPKSAITPVHPAYPAIPSKNFSGPLILLRLILQLLVCGLVFASCPLAVALPSTGLPSGANHLQAHAYAKGAGIKLGILDSGEVAIIWEIACWNR